MQQSIPIIVTGTSNNNTQIFSKRTRRISSSAAAKRFPKDFFKDQQCFHPIKQNRTNNKQNQPSLFDTFSAKKFIAGNTDMQKTKQNRNQSGVDTPKFKQRSSTIQYKNVKTSSIRRKKVKKTLDDSCDSPLLDKYHTISPQVQKNNIIIKTKQIQKQEKQQKNIPFNVIPFISNFNITLGQKLNMVNIINKKFSKNSKNKLINQKQNNYDMIPCLSSRKQANSTKNQGFRIRKKLIN